MRLKYAADEAKICLYSQEHSILDSLNILNVRGILEAKIVSNHFISLKFIVRSGSGMKTRRLVFLCIKESKIFIPLNIFSEIDAELNKFYNKEIDASIDVYEEDMYNIEVAGYKNNLLKINETKHQLSNQDSSKNKEYKISYGLFFDQENCIFYNKKDTITKKICIQDYSCDLKVIETNNVIVPTITLKEYSYFFINKRWYIKNKDGCFYRL